MGEVEADDKFGIADYAVFIVMLAISIAIGIYYAWKDSKETSDEMYLVGGRNMSPFPVAVSLCVSYVSGLMMVGLPTQIYYYGMVGMGWVFITWLSPAIAAIYYIPVYFRLNLTSAYELLQIRFGNYCRVVASSLVIVLMLIYMGLVTYIPCLSLSAVSTIPMKTSIVITCAICTFYTTLGGIKAVVWTDVVQAGVMIVGMVAVIIAAVNASGGSGAVLEALVRSGRWELVYFDSDPFIRNSTNSIILAGVITWTFMAAVNQPMVQRFVACRSVKDARIAVALLTVPQVLFLTMACTTGAVMYAYFEYCDPLESGKLEARDQAVPYMVVKLFRSTPGLAGLYVAAVYSGTLSTISSGINSLSAIAVKDYIIPVRPQLAKHNLKLSKIFVVFFGVLVLIVTFVVEIMGSLVIEAFISAFGSIGGPLLGVYTMAVFMPWTNEAGAVVGQLVGTALSFWLAIGQGLNPIPKKYLRQKPVYTTGCNITLNNTTLYDVMQNQTYTDAFTVETTEAESDEWSIYYISNNYFAVIAFLTCIVVGVIVSAITGFNDPRKANSLIFMPIIDNKIFPQSVRTFFRFGVPEVDESVEEEDESVEKLPLDGVSSSS